MRTLRSASPKASSRRRWRRLATRRSGSSALPAVAAATTGSTTRRTLGWHSRPSPLLAAIGLVALLASPTLAGLGQQAGEPQFAPLPDLRTPVWSVAPRATGIILDVALGVPALPRRPVVRLPPERVHRIVIHAADSVRRATQAVRRSVSGIASYFCGNGSPCTAGYPPGSMVAAACGRLRTAMGSHWRGRVVTVTAGSRSVRITLVDWCGSGTKTIDLYYAVMVRLGGTGVLPVTVSW
jgi:hypothetical protein